MEDTTIFLNSVGMVFESFIIICATILLILIFRKYLIKRHQLTLLLFTIFLFYFVAIVFSWLSKVIVVTQFTVVQDGSIFSWIINRLRDFRLSELFVTVAIFFSYILKVHVFEKGYHPIFKYIVILYGVLTGFYVLVIYEIGNTLLDIFAFLLVFIYMCMIYFPFNKTSNKDSLI